MAKDDIQTFRMNQFEQTPNCNFTIEYTVTLIEKPYGSSKKIPFNQQLERIQPNPKIVTIDFDSWVIKIAPTHESH